MELKKSGMKIRLGELENNRWMLELLWESGGMFSLENSQI